jgi:hypothetical protein
MLSDEMLYEIVLAVTCVMAIMNGASPPFKFPVPFTLMPNPVRLSLERLGLVAVRKCACKRLNVFVDMLRPIGWFLEPFHLETYGTLEFGRKALHRR